MHGPDFQTPPKQLHHSMKQPFSLHSRCALRAKWWVALAGAAFAPANAHASLFHGETLDSLANGISWVAIVIAPIIGITVFWLVHILPEKIAHKKKHPQTRAIQCLCLLSLCFGGLLWPIAWLWAYSKPVLHKLAYGTDVDESLGHDAPKAHDEVAALRAQVAKLEAQLSTRGGQS
jgi:CBS domain containing-hemolysin-like protein